ncbi:MAG: hypothetical protein PF693_07250 [Spirochaetia bacterium]|jgi:hypothetical protein|nr:hypothetical protein [Spirochaetia bacterium]
MKTTSIIIFLMFIAFYSFSLELSEGRIKILLHENSGSFSAYYLEDINTGKYTPFLFDKDPETSLLSIMSDNKIFKMGNSSVFSKDIFTTPTGGKIVWESTVLKVTEEFSFVKSQSSSLSDGFKIKILIENTSDQNKIIGLTYLFDTFLGEQENDHFLLDSGTPIASENSILSNFPNYWISPSSEDTFLGLQGMVRGPGITVPNKIIFANWKRLQDNLWNYHVKKNRNFNLIPYSINDSAVSIIYDPIKVSRQSSREVVIVLGAYNNSSFKGSSNTEDSGIDTLFDQTVSTDVNPQNTETSIKSDLIATTDLLKKIDSFLEFPDNITDGEIDLIVQILETLKQRQKLYENR